MSTIKQIFETALDNNILANGKFLVLRNTGDFDEFDRPNDMFDGAYQLSFKEENMLPYVGKILALVSGKGFNEFDVKQTLKFLSNYRQYSQCEIFDVAGLTSNQVKQYIQYFNDVKGDNGAWSASIKFYDNFTVKDAAEQVIGVMQD